MIFEDVRLRKNISEKQYKIRFYVCRNKRNRRKPINPANMCKLYIYGYFNVIRSSRKLERECTRNIELMWIINDQTLHNKTISDFRKNNKKAMLKKNNNEGKLNLTKQEIQERIEATQKRIEELGIELNKDGRIITRNENVRAESFMHF